MYGLNSVLKLISYGRMVNYETSSNSCAVLLVAPFYASVYVTNYEIII